MSYLRNILLAGMDKPAISALVLPEFIHTATDSKRFSQALTSAKALAVAERWWHSEEVMKIYPSEESVQLSLRWMQEYRLGRKRTTDTFLAASYYAAGVTRILSTNARDYSVFGCFEVITP
ncbi:hypothetical protein QQ056_16075 [Oscillatoria laete-virens NRMC-F 0139]|nr:hypothetical protein [Oscillatoria laete-virens]MDL5055056.1 hypothetical protein [Oscillatoria laete-virens NRMC-F 0139]